jgi:CHAD domain-containing protein
MPNLPETNIPQPILILSERLDKCSKRYDIELKRTRNEFAEEYVHDLRVSIRRLLAAIDMAQAVLQQKKKKSRQLLKMYLNAFDKLRDAQVQLVIVEELQGELLEITAYRDYLREREKKQIARLEKKITEFSSGGLSQQVARLAATLQNKGSGAAVWAVLDDSYATVVQRRQAIRAEDAESIHSARVAFKKFRYQVETIQSLLTDAPEDLLRNLHDYQAAMGEVQDAEVGLQLLGKFTAHSGETLDAVRARFIEMHRSRIATFMTQVDKLKSFWRPAPDQPFPWDAIAA